MNIDADDINDDLSGVEYVDDLYVFYKATEVTEVFCVNFFTLY